MTPAATFLLPVLLGLAILAPAGAAAADNPDAARLGERLRAVDADPAAAGLAAYERLKARQAVDALAATRSRQAAAALQVAEWRVDTAESAVRVEIMRRDIERIERERGELLVEASRREAARARAEAERLRIQAQIQAEEAARMRQAAEEEAQARAEAETALEGVSSREASRLRAARQRAAELARQEAELLKSLEEPADPPAKP